MAKPIHAFVAQWLKDNKPESVSKEAQVQMLVSALDSVGSPLKGDKLSKFMDIAWEVVNGSALDQAARKAGLLPEREESKSSRLAALKKEVGL